MTLRGDRKNENLFTLGGKGETVVSRHDLGLVQGSAFQGLKPSAQF